MGMTLMVRVLGVGWEKGLYDVPSFLTGVFALLIEQGRKDLMLSLLK